MNSRREFLKGTAWMGAAALAGGCAHGLMTLGGDGYLPAQFPAAQRIGQPELPATTDAFVQYLRTWRP